MSQSNFLKKPTPNELDSLKLKLASVESEYAAYRKKNDEEDERYEREHVKLSAKLEKIERNLVLKDEMIEQMLIDLESAYADAVRHQNSISALTNENKKLESVNNGLKRVRNELERVNAELAGKKNVLTDANKKLASKNNELTNDNKQLATENSGLKLANNHLTNDNKQLATENSGLKLANNHLTNDNKQLATENSGLKLANNHLTNDNEQLATENSDLKLANNELQGWIQTLATENVDLKRVNNELASVNEQLQSKNAESSGLFLASENSELEKRDIRIRELCEQGQALVNQNRDLTTGYSKLEVEYRALKLGLQQSQAQASAFRAEINAVRADNSDLQMDLQQSQELLNYTTSQLENCNKQRKLASRRCSILRTMCIGKSASMLLASQASVYSNRKAWLQQRTNQRMTKLMARRMQPVAQSCTSVQIIARPLERDLQYQCVQQVVQSLEHESQYQPPVQIQLLDNGSNADSDSKYSDAIDETSFEAPLTALSEDRAEIAAEEAAEEAAERAAEGQSRLSLIDLETPDVRTVGPCARMELCHAMRGSKACSEKVFNDNDRDLSVLCEFHKNKKETEKITCKCGIGRARDTPRQRWRMSTTSSNGSAKPQAKNTGPVTRSRAAQDAEKAAREAAEQKAAREAAEQKASVKPQATPACKNKDKCHHILLTGTKKGMQCGNAVGSGKCRSHNVTTVCTSDCTKTMVNRKKTQQASSSSVAAEAQPAAPIVRRRSTRLETKAANSQVDPKTKK